MKRILIIRFSSIGDIILTTPVVRALRNRFPDSEIDFLTKIQFVDLLKHNPHLNEIVAFDKQNENNTLRNLKKKLQEKKYDWIIDLHQNLRSLYLKQGFFHTSYPKYTFRRWLITHLGQKQKMLSPIYERYFEAVKPQGVTDDKQGTEVFFTEKNKEKIQFLLAEKKILLPQKKLTICAGASAATKRWLPERFAEVADYFAQKNYQIVFIGGKEDLENTEKIQSLMRFSANSLNLAGKCSLLDSAAVLAHSAVALTHDTGMMHLAQAQKCPVVAIFGATTEHFGFFPMPYRSLVVEKKLPCRPCSFHGTATCPKKHFDCMRTIGSAEVIQAIEKLLGNLT